jgi:putative nucleotidyltransferase with HDIG domain
MESGNAERSIRARLPFWRRLGWRLGASFLLLTAIGILISGFLQYRSEEQLLRRSLGALLLNIARTGALLVDGDLHEKVVSEGRNDTAQYETIRSQLKQIQETNRLGDPVYSLSHVQGEMARFAVISHGQESVGKDYRLVPEIQPILERVLAEGTAAYTGIYHNEHGTWITAFAPIRNGKGLTVAALDVDFRADLYIAELAEVRRRIYFHSLAGALLALMAGILLARRITRPVAQLVALARRVVEGDFSTRVRISARDEIGMLGNVLHLMVERLKVSHESMVDVLVRALEARGKETGSLKRVAKAALAVADHLELSPTQRDALELGALLHDIGEIRTSQQTNGKQISGDGHLSEQHPLWGVEILETVPLLTQALDVVGGHHERYDGTGYPQRLRGEEIPLTARIFAAVDALDAMTHEDALPIPQALEALCQEAGKQFDPRVVEATLKITRERWAEILGQEAGA